MPHGQKAKPKQNKETETILSQIQQRFFFKGPYQKKKKKKKKNHFKKKDYNNENVKHVATWRKSVAGR